MINNNTIMRPILSLTWPYVLDQNLRPDPLRTTENPEKLAGSLFRPPHCALTDSWLCDFSHIKILRSKLLNWGTVSLLLFQVLFHTSSRCFFSLHLRDLQGVKRRRTLRHIRIQLPGNTLHGSPVSCRMLASHE